MSPGPTGTGCLPLEASSAGRALRTRRLALCSTPEPPSQRYRNMVGLANPCRTLQMHAAVLLCSRGCSALHCILVQVPISLPGMFLAARATAS